MSPPLSRGSAYYGVRSGRSVRQLAVERLDERLVLSTFTGSNLAAAGPGSLRAAILSANAAPGADVVNFTVAGIVSLTEGAQPAGADRLDIDGRSSPGFAHPPAPCAGIPPPGPL